MHANEFSLFQGLLPFSRGSKPFSRPPVHSSGPFLKGTGSWCSWPFSRLLLLLLLSPWLQGGQILHELSNCICQLPVTWPTDLVGLEVPDVGLMDNFWVVIHDAQGFEVACPVHFGVFTMGCIGAPVGFDPFHTASQEFGDLVQGFFKPVLRPHPADDVDIHHSQQLLQSFKAGWRHLIPFFKGVVPIQHHTGLLLFQGGRPWLLPLWSLFQGSSGVSPPWRLGLPFQLLEVVVQPLLQSSLPQDLLPAGEAGPALRPAPGSILALGKMLLQLLFNLFQGCSLLLLFFKSFSLLLLQWGKCLFQGLFFFLKALRRSYWGVSHGQTGPLLPLPLLPPRLGGCARACGPGLVVGGSWHTFSSTLHQLVFSNQPCQVFSNLGFFQTCTGFFQTLCVGTATTTRLGCELLWYSVSY